ncbi:hypothetical protein HG536_0D03280 [Torulaspora globosa]|uniref:Protein kinase domain-containing protein n=1 Tax=Torulaspora globosa TaxID=48254 RepID=A0A7G3ZH20_9SACH|nr:uncharacterized protein HG536_0D03280 [Torulaspora globosa]QLL32806.1 hypothetical protein HG536_0D03280 [Torulaspora globosa]
MSFINLFKSLSNFQFPYTLEEKPVYESNLWQAFNGLRKSDSLPITAFKAIRSPQNESLIANAIHKSKVLKIPGLCGVLEIFDSDPQSTFIITERVIPFPWDEIASLRRNAESLELGIYQIMTTLQFLDSFVLGTIGKGSIFIDSKGQWLLFGLELCARVTEIDDPDQFLDRVSAYSSLVGNSSPSERNYRKIDAIQLSSLISQIFGGRTMVPKDWQTSLQALAAGKSTIRSFMNKLQSTETWKLNPLIEVYQHLKELHIKEPQEKLVAMTHLQNSFFENRDLYHNSSPNFLEGLIIPEITDIIKWLITNQGNVASAVARIIPLLATFLDVSVVKGYFPDNSKQLIYDSFGLTDRQIRFLLLIYLPKISKHLNKNEISAKIYPHFIQGMADSDKTLRLQTLKSIPTIVPFITERQLNNELLRYLAKTQVDVDVEIRTWTVIIITQISTLLSKSSGNRSNILATAYTKSLKDPVTKPRLAALHGLAKSIDLFDVSTIANKILTVIAPGLLDKDPLVRRKAKNLFQIYLDKLENEAKALQEISTNEFDAEDIDFDQYGEVDENADDSELVKQFMDTLMLTAMPELTLEQTKTAQEDEWRINGERTQDAGWDGLHSDNGRDFTNAKPANGANATPVAVETFWNDELNQDLDEDAWDDQNFWDEDAAIQENEASIPTMTNVPKTATNTTKRSANSMISSKSRAHRLKSTVNSTRPQKGKPAERKAIDDEEDDDAWIGEW